MTQPRAAAVGFRQIAFIVDEIWHAAGDTSTDTSWYTKRALLAGVYSATELYMLTDYSPDYADTWESLDRRLADVMRLGAAARDVRLLCHPALSCGHWLASSYICPNLLVGIFAYRSANSGVSCPV